VWIDISYRVAAELSVSELQFVLLSITYSPSSSAAPAMRSLICRVRSILYDLAFNQVGLPADAITALGMSNVSS
jgi:hypothetical protein